MVRSGLGFDSVRGLLGPLATRLLVARACEVDNRRRDRLLGDGLGRPPRRGLYVRSVNGRTSSWFRGARVRHEAHIEAGGVDKDVLLIETGDMNDEIDACQARVKPKRPSHATRPCGDEPLLTRVAPRASREKGSARTRRRTGQADRPSPPRRGHRARADRANTLTEIFRQLIDRALHGSGHVANAAAKLIFELASAVNEDEAEEVEGVAWEGDDPRAACGGTSRHRPGDRQAGATGRGAGT
jgi:hypothetical protein